eukprot:scaffold648684_cov42-Prasinocladus_malaysianus.AAC.1
MQNQVDVSQSPNQTIHLRRKLGVDLIQAASNGLHPQNELDEFPRHQIKRAPSHVFAALVHCKLIAALIGATLRAALGQLCKVWSLSILGLEHKCKPAKVTWSAARDVVKFHRPACMLGIAKAI